MSESCGVAKNEKEIIMNENNEMVIEEVPVLFSRFLLVITKSSHKPMEWYCVSS
jgi:hypothetical protein